MKLEQAQQIANKVKFSLSLYCSRIEIAGSTRRKCPEVRDIEIVCIPRCLEGFCSIINSWTKVKGEPTGKYTQRILPEGIKLDIFIANPDNWGLIFAGRTGSATFSHKVLVLDG